MGARQIHTSQQDGTRTGQRVTMSRTVCRAVGMIAGAMTTAWIGGLFGGCPDAEAYQIKRVIRGTATVAVGTETMTVTSRPS